MRFMLAERETILIVDDNEIMLEASKTVLENEYEVVAAKSGKEALDYMLRGPAPDLILLDIIMPNLDGWETFNRLKAISCLRDVPIAFLTSVSSAAAEERAFKMGAAGFIKKPCGEENLKNRIKSLIRGNKLTR